MPEFLATHLNSESYTVRTKTDTDNTPTIAFKPLHAKVSVRARASCTRTALDGREYETLSIRPQSQSAPSASSALVVAVRRVKELL